MHTKFVDLVNAPVKSDEEHYRSFLKSGRKEDLAVVFRKHMSLVFGVCMKYMGEKNAAQNTTIEVYDRLLAHRPVGEVTDFTAYLHTATKNFCQAKKRGEKPSVIEVSDADLEAATEVHTIDRTGFTPAIENALHNLNDAQKACIELFYKSGKSYPEISAELKMSLTAVKSHIQNGKRGLKTTA